MSRGAVWLLLIAATVAVAAGCGFGVADDTGKPIPVDYWKWACPDGGPPVPDAGCNADAGPRD